MLRSVLLFRLLVLLAAIFSVVPASHLAAQEEIRPAGGRIVNGVPTSIQEHPWQVALLVSRPDGRFFCGGSNISDGWVLTAAHCLGAAGRSAKIRVKAGATNYSSEGVWIDAARVEPHAAYDAATQENDIALIKVTVTLDGQAIALANASTVVPVGAALEITGWGATAEGGAVVDSLRKADVSYVATETCNLPDSYDGRIKAGMMCAGFQKGGVDTCQGDSGGPLVLQGQAILVGVTSFGEGCARPHKYGIYTRVSAYRDWISRIMASDAH
jgi:trypsin